MAPLPHRAGASAPGRVNLIGEHTDYALLPVLPVATQHRLVVMAETIEEDALIAASTQFDGVFRSDRTSNPDWSSYLMQVVGLVDTSGGARLAIDGDLPATGGLSSSSALTVASLLALIRLGGVEPDKDELVDLAVRAERGTGVEGGTMDQTLIVHAVAGAALHIDFDPTTWRPIPVPEDIVFVAGYSGTPAPKGGHARDDYNARVVGTRTAALLLGLEPPFLGNATGEIADVISALPEAAPPRLEATELTAGSYRSSEPLPIRAWARHVLGEGERVGAAAAALQVGDIETLGHLFDASHSSLASDFGASTPGLDALVVAARDAGATGARLTGAGFGGWAVAVCHRDRTVAVTEAMATIAGQAFEVRPSGGTA